jgi:3' exoribonuclease, RNase T-like
MKGKTMNENRCHVMIDLETLSSMPDAAIRSIGAVAFDLKGNVETLLHIGVNVESCIRMGMHVDGDTIDWWLNQPKVNQDSLLKLPKYNITVALLQLEAVATIVPIAGLYVWCHGANFDIPVLENAYRCVDRKPWWKYNNIRDTRTLFDVAGYTYQKDEGHDALKDAFKQAIGVCEAYKLLTGGKKDGSN